MSEIASGSIRFNTDSAKMEIYNGEQWWEIDIDHGSGRGLFMGGTPNPDRIDFIFTVSILSIFWPLNQYPLVNDEHADLYD